MQNAFQCRATVSFVSSGTSTLSIEVEGKQNSLFARGASRKCFVMPPNSKICEKIICLKPAGTTNFRGFKEHDLITCESKVQVVVSLSLVIHDTWQTLLQSENVFELGGITRPFDSDMLQNILFKHIQGMEEFVPHPHSSKMFHSLSHVTRYPQSLRGTYV